MSRQVPCRHCRAAALVVTFNLNKHVQQRQQEKKQKKEAWWLSINTCNRHTSLLSVFKCSSTQRHTHTHTHMDLHPESSTFLKGQAARCEAMASTRITAVQPSSLFSQYICIQRTTKGDFHHHPAHPQPPNSQRTHTHTSSLSMMLRTKRAG